MRYAIRLVAGAVGGFVVGAAPAAAQIQASERSTLSQHIAGTVVTIDYSRPSLRGRDSIFGKQVKWGEVWTPGANKATTLTVSRGVRLDGREVGAGSYSVRLRPAADGNWTLYLHPDTTLFHLPHPSVDGMVFATPVTPQATGEAWETLTWDLQRVRAGGAQLQLRWDRTLVSVDLGVETPSTTIAAAVARLYEGVWTVAYGVPDSTTPVDPDDSDRWSLRYDDATSQLLGTRVRPDRAPDADADGWAMVFIPKAEGVFMVGYTMNGELAGGANPDRLWEFVFEGGRPVSFVGRRPDDRIFVRGARVGD